MSDEEEKIKQGDAAVRASQWEAAQRLYEEALALAQKSQNVRSQARALYSLGGLFLTLRQYPKAQGYSQQALLLFQQAKDRQGEGNALNDLGSVARFLGKPEAALAFLAQTLAIRRELGDTLREADTLTNIGNVYGTTGEYTKAREHYAQALRLHQASGNRRSEANTLSNLGTIYRLTGQFTAARQQYEAALAIRRSLKDTAGEASSLYNIGVCHKAVGEPITALQLYDRALSLQEPLGNKAVEATTRAGIASVYADLAQPDKAQALYEEVLALRRSSGDKRGEATALSNLGQVSAMQDKPEQAEVYFQKARTLYQEIKDRAGEADVWNGLGTLYNNLGQYDKAKQAHERAQALYQQLGDRVGEADALSNLGASALLLKQPTQALSLCLQALPLHQQLRNFRSEQTTWDTLGQAQLALGKAQEALTAFQRAIALTEQYRARLGGLTEAKTDTLAASLPTYHRAIALLHQLGRAEEAFALVQKTKGRALADYVQGAQSLWLRALTATEQTKWGLLQEQAATLNQQLIAEAASNEPGSTKRFAERAEQLKKVEVQRATLEDQLTLRHPALARLRPRPSRTSHALAKQLPADTALIEFSLTEKPLAFVVTRAGLTVKALPTSLAVLAQQVHALQTACQSTNQDTKTAVRALSQSLVAPLAPALVGKRRLVLCPEGILWDTPFALLFPQHTVSRALSATLWNPTHPLVSPRVLVYANPELGEHVRFDQSPLLRPIKTPDRPIKTPDRDILSALARDKAPLLSALPGVEREASAIARHFPTAVLRRGTAAGEPHFLQEAKSFSVLHLASHAFLNNAAPMLSCLVLAPPREGSGADGFLTAQEVLTLQLTAELVVLSACNTGQGLKQAGEGVIGLSRAFLVAGAQQVVVSQWSVHDEATAQLMDLFYAGLVARKSPESALREAQRALQKTPRWRHPHYWAAFTLISGPLPS